MSGSGMLQKKRSSYRRRVINPPKPFRKVKFVAQAQAEIENVVQYDWWKRSRRKRDLNHSPTRSGHAFSRHALTGHSLSGSPALQETKISLQSKAIRNTSHLSTVTISSWNSSPLVHFTSDVTVLRSIVTRSSFSWGCKYTSQRF